MKRASISYSGSMFDVVIEARSSISRLDVVVMFAILSKSKLTTRILFRDNLNRLSSNCVLSVNLTQWLISILPLTKCLFNIWEGIIDYVWPSFRHADINVMFVKRRGIKPTDRTHWISNTAVIWNLRQHRVGERNWLSHLPAACS